ncbi:hypothetical protein FBUS_07695 [Fasciolopsis buskii]|uniref:Uncharacterized protein n=1 Tax=Fasciolopsis buskii TaxID=27845 RepID=A0A8E0VLT8_9TREM|nr:hypothetical protein FBUS_07695 [Fasciolopsis buski]
MFYRVHYLTLLVLGFWLHSSYGECPTGFVEINNSICMIGFEEQLNFCDANSMCVKEGGKRGLRLHLPGVNAPRIPNYMLSNNIIFTSITALLNRSRLLLDGWQFGDPGYSGQTIDSRHQTLPWLLGDPNHSAQAIAFYRNGSFVDDPQQNIKATYLVCELSSRPLPGSVERFRKNWPFSLNIFTLLDSEGCFEFYNPVSFERCALT